MCFAVSLIQRKTPDACPPSTRVGSGPDRFWAHVTEPTVVSMSQFRWEATCALIAALRGNALDLVGAIFVVVGLTVKSKILGHVRYGSCWSAAR